MIAVSEFLIDCIAQRGQAKSTSRCLAKNIYNKRSIELELNEHHCYTASDS